MDEPSLTRRSLSLYEVADRVAAADVASLLRQYAGELAIEAKVHRRSRRLRRVARARTILGLTA